MRQDRASLEGRRGGPESRDWGQVRVPRRVGRGAGRAALRGGSPRVTDGKPADGCRRRRAAQGVAGAGREPARLEGTGEGGARRITGGTPAGGRMERGSVSPAGGTERRIVGGARSIASWDGEVGGKTTE